MPAERKARLPRSAKASAATPHRKALLKGDAADAVNADLLIDFLRRDLAR